MILMICGNALVKLALPGMVMEKGLEVSGDCFIVRISLVASSS